jgi:hypothetical protein
MNVNRCLPLVVVAIIGAQALGAPVSTSAQGAPKSAPGVIYNSIGFEHFVVGQTLVGQDGWVQLLPFLNPQAAVVSKDPQQSIRVRGADLISDFDDLDPYDAVGSYRRPLTDCVECGPNGYDAIANGTRIVQIQARVRLDGPLAATRDLFSASIANRVVGGIALGELIVDADGHVYGYTGNDPSGQELPQASAPITLGAWHHLAIELNFVTRTYAFFVDGSLVGGPFLFPAEADTNVVVRGSIVTYARPDGGAFARSSYVVHFDNFSVTPSK